MPLILVAAELARDFPQKPIYLLDTGESVETPMVSPTVIPAKGGIQGTGLQRLPWTLALRGDEEATSLRAFRVAGPAACTEGQLPVS